ncbi:Cna B-type domain-containing protein [Kurthia gibsonii]|uniref:Cna B-type domain-containing protein n=1 Tax=Kurthia gibsonii TaxID=33946 RepID=UPI0031B6EFFE
MKKWLSILCSLCLISTLLINPYVFAAGDDNATKAVIFNGDQYVTDVEMRTPSGTVIENNGTLEVGKTYDLDYQWNLPDNTFEKGDVLNFSIPKEFIIVNQFDFTLSNDGKEVAKAKVLGNKDSYYYIQMTFTTDYISTHSDVSGEFNLQYRLNEKYVKEGSNEIQIPPGEIITVVVPPFETGGGGGGEGAGHPNNSLKNGAVRDVTMKNPETGVFDIPTRIMTWEIGLGRNVLLGKASSFDEISSITVEDEPIDQEIIAVYSFDKSWPDTFAFSKGFFDKSSFSIDSIKENDMGLKRNPTGGYYESFKTEILPQVKEYEEYAQNKGDAFREYALEYSTLPLDEVIEEREFKNKAKITVKYKDDKYPPNSWVLEKKVEWNVGSGSITGKTANVEMKKVDEQSRGLQGAVFDLYKQSRSGEYTKYKENITSNSNGIVRAEKLTTGNYYFQEVKPPTGYELTNERLSFIIETKDLGTTQVKNVGQLKNGSEKTSVSVEKKWDDKNNQDGKRPDIVKVQLYGDGEKVGPVEELAEGDNWSHTWTDLPLLKNGKEIRYTVQEVEIPPDYTLTQTSPNKNQFLFTNKNIPEEVEVSGEKKWNDNNDQDGLRPKQVTVILYADGKEYERQNVSEGDNWTYKFTELPKNNQGKEIVYTVKEVPIPGYTLKVDDTTLTNSHTPSEIDIVGEKKWNDANDQDGQRPEKIYVNLLADGQQIERQVVTAANNWKYEFRNLPEYQNGKKIVYNVTEDEISEYSTVVDDSKLDSVKITNSYTPKKTSRSIIKLWNDEEDQDGKRPTSIQVQLYANAEKQGPAVTLDESNNWEYTWLDLDERKGGKPIVYTAKEVGTPKDYTVTVNEETPGTFIMKNYHKPETVEVKGEKRWDDANNQDGVRPEAIKVNLIADGELMAEKIVTSETDWKYTFTDLPKYKNQGQLIEYKVTEEVIAEYSTEIEGTTINNKHTPYKTSRTVMKFFDDAQNQDGTRPMEITVQLYGDDEKVGEPVLLNEENEWKHTWEDLDERKAGKKIRYTVKEVNTPIGYEVIVDHETTPGMILVTNKHVPEEVELKGEKKWADDGNRDQKRPGKIKVHLFADGKEIQEKTVTEKEDWAYEFTGLPKYRDGGEEIVYTITEDSVPNYTTEIEGMDITNSYTPGKTSVTVTKTWDDQNDLEGKRPEDIRVQLYANDKKEGTTVILNEKNKWTHTWQDLNQNADGKPIKYTVKEVTELKDYEVSIDVENKGNIVITNRLIETPPEEEPPFDGGEEFEPPSSGNEEFEVDGPSNLGTLSPNGNSFQNVPYEIERPIQKENLPKTGEKTNPWYIVVGVILCLLAIFFIFRNRRHKKQNR